MKNQDKLGTFLKELPSEQPSLNFTNQVMHKVRLEAEASRMAYQPLISINGWRIILLFVLSFLGLFFVFGSYQPGNEPSTIMQVFEKVDFSLLLKPARAFANSLNHLSFTFLAGVLSILLLLLVDQLYASRVTR